MDEDELEAFSGEVARPAAVDAGAGSRLSWQDWLTVVVAAVVVAEVAYFLVWAP